MKAVKKVKKVAVKKVARAKVVNNKSNNKMLWIVGGVAFVLLAAGAIYMGTKKAENEFGGIVSKKSEPTIAPKIIDIAEPKPTYVSRLMPTGKLEATVVVEPSVMPDGEASEGGYLLPISNSKKLSKEDLADFTNLELKKVRNEIYARHGRAFVSQDMACYFATQSWYKVNPNYSEKLLSSLEISNAVFILNYEKERLSPLVNKDSGCAKP